MHITKRAVIALTILILNGVIINVSWVNNPTASGVKSEQAQLTPFVSFSDDSSLPVLSQLQTPDPQPTEEKGPIFTFDDCEYVSGRGNTSKFIQILKSHHIGPLRAVFFVIGDCSTRFNQPDVEQAIRESGYQIGNHTKSHSQLASFHTRTAWSLSDNRVREEIGGGIKGATYWRPPGCATNSHIDELVANEFHLVKMGCDVFDPNDARTVDVIDYNPPKSCQFILQRLLSNVKENSIIMMHLFSTNSPQALDAYLNGSTRC